MPARSDCAYRGHREWIPSLQPYARTGDLFWSDDLNNPPAAIDQFMQVFAENVRLECREPPLCRGSSWRTLAETGGAFAGEGVLRTDRLRADREAASGLCAGNPVSLCVNPVPTTQSSGENARETMTGNP